MVSVLLPSLSTGPPAKSLTDLPSRSASAVRRSVPAQAAPSIPPPLCRCPPPSAATATAPTSLRPAPSPRPGPSAAVSAARAAAASTRPARATASSATRAPTAARASGITCRPARVCALTRRVGKRTGRWRVWMGPRVPGRAARFWGPEATAERPRRRGGAARALSSGWYVEFCSLLGSIGIT